VLLLRGQALAGGFLNGPLFGLAQLFDKLASSIPLMKKLMSARPFSEELRYSLLLQ